MKLHYFVFLFVACSYPEPRPRPMVSMKECLESREDLNGYDPAVQGDGYEFWEKYQTAIDECYAGGAR
jgi:hypothetical protein